MLLRAGDVLVVLVTIGAALMTFEPVRQYGVSLFASAGVAGIVAGLAARPVLTNLFAGVQLAMTQPIRIDDAVIVEDEWGTIEEITSTYVVVNCWDWRRMIVPLSLLHRKAVPELDARRLGADRQRAVLRRLPRAGRRHPRPARQKIVKTSKNWDGRVVNLQVTDAKEQHHRAALPDERASSAGQAFDLRCEVREKLIDFLQQRTPGGAAAPTLGGGRCRRTGQQNRAWKSARWSAKPRSGG